MICSTSETHVLLLLSYLPNPRALAAVFDLVIVLVKTKIKSFEGKINTNFHDDKIPKEGSHFICLSVILMILVTATGLEPTTT